MFKKINTIIYIILFFNPLSSHIARENFEYHKIDYNMTNDKLSYYDTTFLITYSSGVLINGIICSKIRDLNYKIIHLQIALISSGISNYLFYIHNYNIIIWNIHAFFTSALWPISFSISLPLLSNNFLKCLWTLNGPIGEYFACYIDLNHYYLPSVIYFICFFCNFFIFIANYHNKNLNNLILYISEIINTLNNDYNENLITVNTNNELLLTNYYQYNLCRNSLLKKITKVILILLLSFHIKFLSYSTSNWLPNINKELYTFYSLFNIIGTVIIGIKTYYFTKINRILFILSSCLISIYIINIASIIGIIPRNIFNNYIYSILGILLSEISTLVSILLCDKNYELVGGIAIMTGLMDFSGTIVNALMQLVVYQNFYLYMLIFSCNLFILSGINTII